MTLHSINSPDDLKKLSREELPALADELREFVLLDLQSIRMFGVLAQHVEIELGDLAGAAIAVLVIATDQTLCFEFGSDAELVHHVDGGRMEGRRPQGARQFRSALEQNDRNACLHESQCSDATDGTCARDDDRLGDGHENPRLRSDPDGPHTGILGVARGPCPNCDAWVHIRQ